MKKYINELGDFIKNLRPFFLEVVTNAISVIFVASCVIVTLAICSSVLVIVCRTTHYLLT